MMTSSSSFFVLGCKVEGADKDRGGRVEEEAEAEAFEEAVVEEVEEAEAAPEG